MAGTYRRPPAQTGRPIRKRLTADQYSVVWFCATDEEERAARASLDEIHDDPQLYVPSDVYFGYGEIHSPDAEGRAPKNIVIVRGTGSGKVNMAHAAAQVNKNFRITHSFFVGVAGALPHATREGDPANDLFKGDVVVAWEANSSAAVLQYDYVDYHGEHDSRPKHRDDSTSPHLKSLLRRWWGDYTEGHTDAEQILKGLISKAPDFAAPPPAKDLLFHHDQPHIGEAGDCKPCCTEYCDCRTRPDDRKDGHYPIRVWRGQVVTGDKVIRSPDLRAHIKSQTWSANALCADMESSVLMDHFHPLIIRGISDYADSHYGWEWTQYAAATAAAVAKDIIRQLYTPGPAFRGGDRTSEEHKSVPAGSNIANTGDITSSGDVVINSQVDTRKARSAQKSRT